MTVEKLIEKLSEYPKDMEVLINVDDGDFDIAPVEVLIVKSVTWNEGRESEPPKGEDWPEEDCLILSEL
jgi:hypothetical protein